MYQKLVNTEDYTTPEVYKAVDGTVYPAGSVVPAGKYLRDTGDTGRKRSQVGTLYTVGKKGQVIAATGSPEDIKSGYKAVYQFNQIEEYRGRKLETLKSSRLAQSIINLVDLNPRATAITGGLTGDAITLAQKFDVWLGGWTGKDFKAFERGLGSLGIFKNVDVSAGGKVASNASSLFGLSDRIDRAYVDGIQNVEFGSAKEGSVKRTLTDDEFNALQGLAALDIGMRARLWKMAYAVARVSEPGGRLTDRDFANALAQMGVDANGNYDPASLKATLSDLAASAQQDVVDEANTINPEARLTVESIFGPKGQYPDAPVFKGGNLEKLLTPEPVRKGDQPAAVSSRAERYPNLIKVPGLYNSETKKFDSEAVGTRLTELRELLSGNLTEDQKVAVKEEITRVRSLSNELLEQ